MLALLSRNELEREPVVAMVNPETCSGCWSCLQACPFKAIEKKEIRDRNGKVIKYVAQVNPGMCQGCGTCVALCRSNSIDLAGYSERQIFGQVMGL